MTKRNDDIEQLFKAHYTQMYRLAAALLHDDELARDTVHDIFAALLDGGAGTSVPKAYLLRAVRNRCLNHIRDCGTRERIAMRYFLDNEEYDIEEWPDEETVTLIYNLISHDISPQARRVMELRFSAGMQFAGIAREMGISETAVYRHLNHALKFIRQKLNENG